MDPLYRAHHQNQLTFSFTYAYSENFVLPLSHDEVVHEKGSLLGKMPGDRWQRFANVRALFGFMYAQPGKKLMFMGDEFGQDREWNHDRSLDWHLLEDESHRALQQLVGDLNRAYRSETALHELDAEQAGTEWIVSDRERSVVAFARRARAPHDLIVAVANFTPIVRHDYRLTDKGLDLYPVLVSLLQWGDRYAVGPAGPPVELRHRDCGEPVHVQLSCAAGHVLDSAREVTPVPGPGARKIA